jgi:hypothetical protein
MDWCLADWTAGIATANRKANRLRAWLGAREAIIYAYGDSRGDREMLADGGLSVLPHHAERGEKLKKLLDLIRLMRPHQWVKNAFVFTGLIFGHLWGDADLVFRVVGAAIGFSLVSSSVYTLNDILDRAADAVASRKKRSRPLAAGRVSVTGGGQRSGSVLMALGLELSVGGCQPAALAMLFGYGCTEHCLFGSSQACGSHRCVHHRHRLHAANPGGDFRCRHTAIAMAGALWCDDHPLFWGFPSAVPKC